MYNSKELLPGFASLVGFLPGSDPAYPTIGSNLLKSDSGLFVQTTHPLCTLENLYNCSPEFSKYIYPAYDNAATYKKGMVVVYGGNKYYAPEDIDPAGILPGVANSLWVAGDGFSAWLQQQYEAGVQRLFADLIRLKKLDSNNKQLIDSLLLFDGVGSYSEKIIKRDRFVGLMIKVNQQEGLAAQITQLGLQMTGDAVIPMYLYHSSQVDPVKQFNVEITKGAAFQWFSLADTVLSYINSEYNAEGLFYLGYYEEDLPPTVQAINRRSNWGAAPCIGCSEWNLQSWKKWSRHLDIQAFYINQDKYGTKGEMFDELYIQYNPDTNFGINLKVTVSCDLTGFYTGNKLTLSDALAMSICVKLLEQIGYTTRLSAIADQTKMLALKDLSVQDPDSFYNRYMNEIKAMSLDFSGMSSDCMPCIGAKGIKQGAA